MKQTAGLLLAVLTALGAPACHASNTEVTPQQLLESYLASPIFKAYLDKAVDFVEPPPLRAQCPHLIPLEYTSYIPIEPVSDVTGPGGLHYIDKGKWISRVIVDRCGTKTTRRYLLEAVPGANQVRPMYLLPGDFRGDLRLEMDAMRIVVPPIAASAKCNNYEQIFVLDVARSPRATADDWSELWTISACASVVKADVTYSRKKEGVLIVSHRHKD